MVTQSIYRLRCLFFFPFSIFNSLEVYFLNNVCAVGVPRIATIIFSLATAFLGQKKRLQMCGRAADRYASHPVQKVLPVPWFYVLQ